MTSNDKKAVARRAIELWATESDADADELLAASYVNHQEPSTKGGRRDESRRSYEALIRHYHEAFSDAEVEVRRQLAEGDRVATHWRFSATHTGEYRGVPPTHRRITWTGISVDRFEDGKIAESWVDWDMFTFLDGLGLVERRAAA